MKKTIFLLLIFLPFFAISQTRHTGISGGMAAELTGWGSSASLNPSASAWMMSLDGLLLFRYELGLRRSSYNLDAFRQTGWWLACDISMGIAPEIGDMRPYLRAGFSPMAFFENRKKSESPESRDLDLAPVMAAGLLWRHLGFEVKAWHGTSRITPTDGRRMGLEARLLAFF